MNKLLIYFICMSFIFIGAMCYTIASFYHLKYNYQWSFSKDPVILESLNLFNQPQKFQEILAKKNK